KMPANSPSIFSSVSSASSSISTASLPPSSSTTPVMVSAAMAIMRLPPLTEPVKHTLATSSLDTKAAPISASSPVITFSTPGGKLSANRMTARVIAKGADGGGLTITVLPASSAYGREAPRIAMGQLNGTIIVTTPGGLCDTTVSVGGPGRIPTPSTSSTKEHASSVRCTRPSRSNVDSPTTLPFSADSNAASSSAPTMTVSDAANNRSARYLGLVSAHSGNACFAAATASNAWAWV